MMKRIIFVFLVAITIVSCDLSNDGGTQFELGPVETVTMPATFRVDSVSQIMIGCVRPTDCHIFNGFYYDISGFTRTVAIEFAKVDGECNVEDYYVYDVPLNFKPREAGTYHFKFWSGIDQEGNYQYIEVDAVVPE